LADNGDLDLTVPSALLLGGKTPRVIEGVAERPDGGASVLPAGHAPAAPDKPRRRTRSCLRILLAINALLAAIFPFAQINLSTAKKLGPAAEYAFRLLHPSDDPELFSDTRQRLMADVANIGGSANFMGWTYRFLGRFDPIERYRICIDRPNFGDEDLDRLVRQHGSRISALDLRNTRVTNEGLRHLEGLSQIHDLILGNDGKPFRQPGTTPVSPITDAGLIHLKGLKQLTDLTLCGLPITDSGLGALKDLPQLRMLNLSRTNIEGPGLAGLKSLPALAYLYLNDGALTEKGLGSIAGASNLQVLSLNQVQLTLKGLQALRALPSLHMVDLTGCGLLDEEVRDLTISKPGLRILRY
jgi:hypothetical protein